MSFFEGVDWARGGGVLDIWHVCLLVCVSVLEEWRKSDCACERRAKGMNDRGSREGKKKQGRDKVSRLFSCDVEQLPVSAKGQRCSCLPSQPSHSPSDISPDGEPWTFPPLHKTQLSFFLETIPTDH